MSLPRHTGHTCVSKRELKAVLAETRERGYSVAARTFDNEVVSIAAPIFDASGSAIGAMSVASIASRFGKGAERRIAELVLRSAARLTEATGGMVHPAVAAAIDRLRA
jgi:DNA-binding IclR family transcriptional regulator